MIHQVQHQLKHAPLADSVCAELLSLCRRSRTGTAQTKLFSIDEVLMNVCLTDMRDKRCWCTHQKLRSFCLTSSSLPGAVSTHCRSGAEPSKGHAWNAKPDLLAGRTWHRVLPFLNRMQHPCSSPARLLMLLLVKDVFASSVCRTCLGTSAATTPCVVGFVGGLMIRCNYL
jgi:hypothetical protein